MSSISQTHRETDLFFPSSGVQIEQYHCCQFHYLHVTFSSQIKSKIGNILPKVVELRITLNIEGEPVVSRSDTHLSHSETSHLVCEVCRQQRTKVQLRGSSIQSVVCTECVTVTFDRTNRSTYLYFRYTNKQTYSVIKP